ncbi:hypothetical protein G6F46_000215 [Rhizopus delemar]|uniref:Uncharacterized protein n=3 Tax=Rhizopus TaxID=4842 RepID=I1BZ04_RHIO9|nr:hypothetical protein RO3G_06139 [Rhizopus delemar RA 99-880]KAG1462661.1 hypothetical protein G6F55_002840 [Rhizopus delemar]KAG1550224.1 hypothetical protein G6F51_002565 [Rhizopus arrhizus]KAG1500788.1 hypothetical protein G6F54_003489 [Rhizopus delemar]KAG1509400.1 hypothetical protein G6F52_011146 [Rhizopus delemar]|eukprot:EIE81434.1 hypothetical protein RO3G_06139 [Rhizopus delemar RA 99-880]
MSIENLAESFNRVHFSSESLPQQRQYNYASGHKSKSNRNPQCMPSDDENSSSEDEKEKKKASKHRSNPLPSDDEDDNETSDDDCLIPRKKPTSKSSRELLKKTLRQTRSDGITNAYSNNNKLSMNTTRSTDDLTRTRRTSQQIDNDDDDEIIGQQLIYQQQHDAVYQMHQYQQQHYHAQQRKQQQQQMRMSGMDLLIQREQEKAESKRQKPKIVPGKVKIEGLLSKLPEQGTHNISFQQLQLQQQTVLKPAKKVPKAPQQQPAIYPSIDYGRVMYNPSVGGMPNTFYQLPSIPISNGNLYMNYNTTQPLRPGSVMSTNTNNNNNSHRQLPSSSIPFV